MTTKTRLDGVRPRRRPSRSPLLIIVGVAVVVAAVIAVLVSTLGDDDETTTSRVDFDTAQAAVDGTALAALPDGDDPAVGQVAPVIEGVDRDGTARTAPASGRPTVLLLLAHWCPHCEREVPVVQDWVSTGRVPDGVDFVAVSTAVTSSRPNYPPSDWFDRAGWTVPTIADANGEAAQAYGLTAFPFWVAVDAQGRVVERITGELGESQFEALLAAAASS